MCSADAAVYDVMLLWCVRRHTDFQTQDLNESTTTTIIFTLFDETLFVSCVHECRTSNIRMLQQQLLQHLQSDSRAAQ